MFIATPPYKIFKGLGKNSPIFALTFNYRPKIAKSQASDFQMFHATKKGLYISLLSRRVILGKITVY